MAVIWQAGGSRLLREKVSSFLAHEFAVRKFEQASDLLESLKLSEFKPDFALILDVVPPELKKALVSGIDQGPKLVYFEHSSEKSRCFAKDLKNLRGQLSENSGSFRRLQSTFLSFKDLKLDLSKRFLSFEAQQDLDITLPSKECQILAVLMRNAGQTVSRDTLAHEAWSQTRVSTVTLNSHMSRLRSRIKESELSIETVYGGGYILK